MDGWILASFQCIQYKNYLFMVLYNNCIGTLCGGSPEHVDLSLNSKCYRKFRSSLTWWNASNDCLSHGGSLAVFTDIGRPSEDSHLTKFLTNTGTGQNRVWIGLIRSWWITTSEGEFALLCKESSGDFNVFYTIMAEQNISWLRQNGPHTAVR